MTLTIATLALLTLFISAAFLGVWLLRRRGVWRIVGIVLLLQALLALAAQIVLSTLPFGIGEPLIRVDFTTIIAQTLLALAVIGLIGWLTWMVWRRVRYVIDQQERRRLLITGLLLAVPLIGTLGMYTLIKTSLPARERERDPLKREITMAPGFEWSVYAQGTMDNPTCITFAPDGDLYIADIAGDLWLARDTDNNQQIDSITKWAGGFDLLVGLLWIDDELYTASSGKIEALRDSDGDGVADQRRTVVDGLPSLVLRPHSNNSLTLGPDGRIYFGVGSTTNGRVEDHPNAAAVLSVKPDGSDLKVYARGFGNTFAVAFNSEGAMFGGDNSPIGGEGNDLPDEFNYIVEGEHYGYPYYYGDEPDSGGTRAPLVSFPAHSVPTGVTFYSGDTYPPAFKDRAFITLWQTGEVEQIEVARTSSGDYLARRSPFASGFLYPIDVVTGPDGNLYIADFGTSAIYRITYNGPQQ